MAKNTFNSPDKLYRDAVRYYADPEKWTRGRLISKRMRMVVRLLALEDRCQQLDIGALPPRIMATLRLLAEYREATAAKYYQHGRRVQRPRTPGPTTTTPSVPADTTSTDLN